MIDSFVLLAPIYLLGVIALLGFVGCQVFWDVDEYEPGGDGDPIPDVKPGPPTNLVAVAGDAAVALTWDEIPDATEYHVLRSEMSGSVAGDYPDQSIILPDWLPWTDKDLVNGTTYFYRVTAVNSVGESDLSNEVSATPNWPFGAFVTSVMPGMTRPGENGLFGMAIEIGPVPLKIQTLGRGVDPQFTGLHEVRLIDGASNVELGHASVDMNSPKDANGFRYAPLEPADPNVPEIIVEAGGTYYIVSQEFTGGDEFYDQDTTVQTRPEAQVVSAISSDSPGLYTPIGGLNTFGPVSFQY
jgi:hypothetical protein